MTIHCLCILLWTAVIQAELYYDAQIWDGEELHLGPYDARVRIGSLPDRYKQMTADDQKVSYNLRRLLELLRKSFSTGMYKIPPLDPYISSNLTPFTLNVPLLSGKIDVKQIKMTGLQTFHLELLEARLNNHRIDFAFKVPVLIGIATIGANLTLGGLIPVTIEGKLRVKLQNVRVEGALSAVEKLLQRQDYYSVQSLHAHFHADDVRFTMDGLNLDRDILESLQTLDLFGSSKSLEKAEKVINYYIAHEILNQLNSIVGSFSIEQVNAYLRAR